LESDVKLIWAKIRALWETGVRATHYASLHNADSTTGEIHIDEFAWSQLARVSLIFLSINATFSSLSISFLDMFVASLFLFFLVGFYVFFFALTLQNSRMNPNHTIEKNKLNEKVKTINFAFCLVWMVHSLLFLLSGLPCSVAFRWNEVSGICGLVD